MFLAILSNCKKWLYEYKAEDFSRFYVYYPSSYLPFLNSASGSHFSAIDSNFFARLGIGQSWAPTVIWVMAFAYCDFFIWQTLWRLPRRTSSGFYSSISLIQHCVDKDSGWLNTPNVVYVLDKNYRSFGDIENAVIFRSFFDRSIII